MAFPALPHNGLIRTNEGRVAAPRMEDRLIQQNQRVRQGVQTGTVSGEELAQVRTQRGDFHGDLAEAKGNDGRVDRSERVALHQELNDMSAALWGFKHN